ncbi:MAG TPA: DUF2147 domain-containing protein [Candidatus Binatia bacterium]|jgi:uncharacterized protein (DUF2147 family)
MANSRVYHWFSAGIVLLFAAVSLGAAEPSPAGLWKTIDDHTGQPKGLVRLREVNGQYEGKIEKIFPKPGDDPAPKCDKCDGARHNQPVLGMTFLWGLTKQGDEYQGGEILDPENGKTYRAKMKLIDGGKKLEVRGFIGFSLLGRSQTWLREE